jgi:hypothetical protein
MKVGDRIAIKAAFVQKNRLPFDSRGHSVSVMRLKARGVITAASQEGSKVSVAWDEEFEPRDWFFYTYRPTIWEVHTGNEMANRLIDFAFSDEPQDLDWFRDHGSWSTLFGDGAAVSVRRFWIEKILVTGRSDREHGDNALGRSLWSPQLSRDGKNIYGNMLQVRAGDVVLHLTDNEAISSVSVADGPADASFVGAEGTDWAGQPSYRISLSDNQALAPALPRAAFLDTEPFATELGELAANGAKGLFYNRSKALNQGAYLTEATPTLLSILNRAYERFAGKTLPYLDAETPSAEQEQIAPYTLDDALQTLFIERDVLEEILLCGMPRRTSFSRARQVSGSRLRRKS